MCGSLSEEGAALKVFISKLQAQLTDALAEANGLRSNAKSLEAKVFELMSETQMYRGQIDELQVSLLPLCFFNFSSSFQMSSWNANAVQSLLLCAKDQQRSLGCEAQAKADRAVAELKAQLATANRLLSEEQVKFFQESDTRQHLEVQLKDSSLYCGELGSRIKDLDSSNRQLQERLTSASQQVTVHDTCSFDCD